MCSYPIGHGNYGSLCHVRFVTHTNISSVSLYHTHTHTCTHTHTHAHTHTRTRTHAHTRTYGRTQTLTHPYTAHTTTADQSFVIRDMRTHTHTHTHYEQVLAYKCAMSYVWMSHASHTDESSFCRPRHLKCAFVYSCVCVRVYDALISVFYGHKLLPISSVCVCVCVCAWMCARVYLFVYLCGWLHKRTHVCGWLHKRTHVCGWLHKRTHYAECMLHMCVCTCMSTCGCMHACIQMHLQHIYTCIYTCTCRRLRMFVYIQYMYRYICIHTSANASIDAHKPKQEDCVFISFAVSSHRQKKKHVLQCVLQMCCRCVASCVAHDAVTCLFISFVQSSQEQTKKTAHTARFVAGCVAQIYITLPLNLDSAASRIEVIMSHI